MKNIKFFSVAFLIFASLFCSAQTPKNEFIGMWTLEIDGGGVGWLEVHEKEGFLDADLLWWGGSVTPVSNVYLVDESTLVVTRTNELSKSEGRKHVVTHTLTFNRNGEKLSGISMVPARDGLSIEESNFKGWKLPDVGQAPDLSKVKYAKPISLFNGENLDGWKMVNQESANGFKVVDGVLVNDPVTAEGKRVHYGNLRTKDVFEDFKLTLEVNIPSHSNSGVYLRGMYEIQVYDSYGKELDSHNMGGVYSRVTPSVAAEKPAGEWQTMEMILCKRHISVVLNGKTIVDNKPAYGPTGGAIIADVFQPGPIYLQGDHGKVSYRNIVLTPIK